VANSAAITLHASAAETTTAAGAAVELKDGRSCVKLDLIVTAVSGTDPTMTIALETGPSATGPWRPAGSFAVQSATGKTSKTFAGLDAYVREQRTIGGTLIPTFTYSLAGLAHQLYAEPSDLANTAILATAIAGIDDAVKAECCLRATADAETALNSAYELPITSWGEDLRGHTAARAVFYAMNSRGRKPRTQTGNADDLIDTLGGFTLAAGVKSAAQSYFDAIAKGTLKPVGIVDQTPDDFEGSGFVVSGEARNW
jgi:hypothetical protein